MKAVEKLVNGEEIDLEELPGRANQAQIQKVSEFVDNLLLVVKTGFTLPCAVVPSYRLMFTT